jgi:PEP-CTERM motif
MKHHHIVLSSAACLLAMMPSANAAIIIDNLASGTQSSSQSLSGPTATGFFGPTPFVNREVAFSFTTASTNVHLTDLTLQISLSKAILEPVRITMSTGSTVPGGTNSMILGDVTPSSSTPTSQLLTLIPSFQVLLAANTTYWMHLTVPTGAAVYSFQNTNSVVTEPGWSLGNSWSRDPSSSWNELSSGPQARIRMSVEPIPEPSAMLLGGCGLALLLRRRK